MHQIPKTLQNTPNTYIDPPSNNPYNVPGEVVFESNMTYLTTITKYGIFDVSSKNGTTNINDALIYVNKSQTGVNASYVL